MAKAHNGSMVSAGEARNALVLRYLPAVRRYVRALVQNEEDANDVAQDIVVRLLAGDFAGADPNRGRFRDLFKVAIRNMVRNYWSRQKRRRGTPLDLSNLAEEQDEADDPWLASWRRSVLDLAWKALKQQQERRAGNLAYTLLRLRTEHPGDTSEQLASRLSQKLGKPVRADALRQQLRRARLQFADLLIAEIGKSFDDPTPEKIEGELIALGLLEFVRDLAGKAEGGRRKAENE
jgi:RNA polymerase sigma factor (sigma-70 family)